MSRVAIVGCGNIGYRHLQGIAAVSSITEIHVVDPQAARLSDVTSGPLRPKTQAQIVGHNSVDGLRDKAYRLVISAVTADLGVIIAGHLIGLESQNYLLEKPLGQSKVDIQRISSIFGSRARSVFVNCPRGMWAGYSALSSHIQMGEPVRIEISGNMWGFGCNAVHFIDLFRVLCGDADIRATGAQLSNAPGGNKRGSQYEEFVGTASYENRRGDLLQLTCGTAGESAIGCLVTIRNRENGALTFLVDETSGAVWRKYQQDVFVEPLEPMFVSQSTSLFLEHLQNGDVPTLPDLELSVEVHRAFFESLTLATGRQEFNIT